MSVQVGAVGASVPAQRDTPSVSLDFLRARTRIAAVGWRTSYRRLVLVADKFALVVASLTAWFVRFGASGNSAQLVHDGYSLSYLPIAVGIVPIWLVALA